mmetsp:Transcript_84933/g.182040  ORF Transcript_84933/g.182040 Transcript_84933/m.182040 type:complete len:241 (+) Transcript_84933:439-1161(+)
MRDRIVPGADEEVLRRPSDLALLPHPEGPRLCGLACASLRGLHLLGPRRLGLLLGRLPLHKLPFGLLDRLLRSSDLLGHVLSFDLLQALTCIPADAAEGVSVLSDQLRPARALARCAAGCRGDLDLGICLLHHQASAPLCLRPRPDVLVLRHHEIIRSRLCHLCRHRKLLRGCLIQRSRHKTPAPCRVAHVADARTCVILEIALPASPSRLRHSCAHHPCGERSRRVEDKLTKVAGGLRA